MRGHGGSLKEKKSRGVMARGAAARKARGCFAAPIKD